MKAKKLIEVALPIKEISAESVRDKTIHHGHISTMHPWWARRPLPCCRAVVFASVVPDPLDENCPKAFCDAIDDLLNNPKNGSKAKYMPYKDIPYTAILDPVEDNRRNRLMAFIGQFSAKCQQNMLLGKDTNPKEQLSDYSLIKWESKDNPEILKIARKLIWVAFNAEKSPVKDYTTLSSEFDEAYKAILDAENALYNTVNRHLENNSTWDLKIALKNAIELFQSRMPSVFDPFAGGGAIPLEAARLGCRSYGNDINPVAHIIEKSSAEYPQKYGKPIIYTKDEFQKRYGIQELESFNENGISNKTLYEANGKIFVSNRLSFDVEFYAKLILSKTKDKIGWMYPPNAKGDVPIAFYWVRTAKCSNPSCQASIPMLKSFDLANTSSSHVYLEPHIEGKRISFQIKSGKSPLKKGWNNRGNVICPCCNAVTDVDQVKKESLSTGLKARLIASIYEANVGKIYEIPTPEQIRILDQIVEVNNRPTELMHRNSNGGDTFSWGFTKWADLFTDRQLFLIENLIEQYKIVVSKFQTPYEKALSTCLALWIDRIILLNTSFGRWSPKVAAIVHLFGRQAIAMTADYPESNPFCSSSGSALNQLDWVVRYLESENKIPFSAVFSNASSGDKLQFKPKSLTAVVTDPPYYDAIAYADISDFFYIWLKRLLADIEPLSFATPQTPKEEECTALKHHHNDDENLAKQHFEHKLTQIFDSIELQTKDIVSIMFAHQSTEAWTTLCNSILDARMNITGSWPMDTERDVRMLAIAGAALESSVTVACRPSERKGFGDFSEVKAAIEKNVAKEVESLYQLGFRGADLLTACFGQAVSEFGHYKTVEKADGTEVTVGELLELARNAAFNTLLKGVQGDDYTRFYVGWLQMNGAGDADYDDATKFTRVGLPVNIHDILNKKLLIGDGKHYHLAMAEEHLGDSGIVLGTRPEDSLIEQVHRAMLLYKSEHRVALLTLIKNVARDENGAFWRLLASLKELLPAGDDLKQVEGLLQNAADLRQSCMNETVQEVQGTLDLGI